ncbi:MAG: hypothetical protein IT353_23245 [Gemmatimonadaceae bacterium]|nr:hypothetical protein [Gemmatimonadaceae bacterium]
MTQAMRTDPILPASATHSADEAHVLADVRAIRRTLQAMTVVRVALLATAAALMTMLVLELAGRGGAMSASTAAIIAVIVAAIVAGILVRVERRWSMMRTALFIEEQGGSGFALVTWIEQVTQGADVSDSLSRVVSSRSLAARDAARRALGPLARRQLMGPGVFSAALLVVLWFVGSTHGSTQGANDRLRATDVAAPSVAARAPLGAWRVRLTPPPYAQQTTRDVGDTNSVRVLSGTRVELIGDGPSPDTVVVRRVSRQATNATTPGVSVAEGQREWRASLMADDAAVEMRVQRAASTKLLIVEGYPDSVPRLTLTAPLRDSVLRTVTTALALEARATDDLGLASGYFDVMITSGEGEQFTVKRQQIAARRFGGARDATLRTSLDLATLALGPGDVVHIRAVARDAHPLASREMGASETRSIRIARPSEYDSVAVEPAPPPEVDKSLLSQRMLLLLTERLHAKRARLDAPTFQAESRKLARDQGRLRQAVGDAVFQRLTGEQGGEHAHSVGDGHDHGVEAIGGKLALSSVSPQGMLQEGDDAPVIAINAPLLEAYNAMWDAGRALEQADTKAAIPFMRIALEAIERARAASRLYLRGRPPTVIIDLAKVRLVGKDTGAPVARLAREALPRVSAEREVRLLRAAALAASNVTAARDTLALLRVDALGDAPAFAAALSQLLAQLSSAGAVDVTASFINARRVLGGVQRLPSTAWSRGSPP